MDSPSSSLSSMSAADASRQLKDLLQVGKLSTNSDSSSAVSMPADVEQHPDTASSENDIGSNKSGVSGDVMDLLFKSITKHAITRQHISLTGDDSSNSFSVYGRDVDIVASKSSSTSRTGGSNKVKINPVVNFEWESKHYIGQLVAVHRNCTHVAYVLRGKSGGIVRVINRRTAERALLKGFSGRVLDVAFAHLSSVVLGAVDEMGNMFVYEILEDKDGKIDTTLLLQVMRNPSSASPSDNHRLIWCPYIPEEEEDESSATTNTDSSMGPDSVGKLLVLTHDNVAEMWNVDMVTKEYGAGPLLNTDIDVGCLTINSHTQAIVDASFSPDGTALATASHDGYVKFFQVYMHEKSPKCLHQWQPHEGKPVSSLFFLDDHKQPNPEVQFWKFAVTGGNNNQEVRIWSCETWSCLQTLSFSAPADMPSNLHVEPCLKAALDLSANYLILSDIKRKVVYVLQLYQDASSGLAHVSSLSEFLLAQPCLSFAILDASRRKFHKAAHDEGVLGDITTGEVEVDDEEEEVSSTMQGPDVGVLVKMYAVHTRALQELQIRYQAESSVPQAPPTSLSQSLDADTFRDRLSDFSHDTLPGSLDVTAEQPTAPTTTMSSSSQPLLLTPDAFVAHTATVRRGDSLLDGVATDSITVHSSCSSMSSLTQVTGMDEDALRSARQSIRHSDSLPLQHHHQHSPASSITLTPASSRDLSAQGSPHHLINPGATSTPSNPVTPGSVPLPPPTPGEEAALAGGGTASSSSSMFKDLAPPGTPPSSKSGGGVLDPTSSLQASATSLEFLTSSPAAHNKPPRSSDFNPPQPVTSTAESLAAIDLSTSGEDVLSPVTGKGKRRTPLRSTGSSSSTSLEVSEILESAQKGSSPGGPATADFDDDEEEEEENEQHLGQQSADTVQATSTADGNDNANVVKPDSGYDFRIWPKPPELSEVTEEAQRLATEAIQRAAGFHKDREVDDSAEVPEEQLEADEEDEEEGELHIGGSRQQRVSRQQQQQTSGNNNNDSSVIIVEQQEQQQQQQQPDVIVIDEQDGDVMGDEDHQDGDVVVEEEEDEELAPKKEENVSSSDISSASSSASSSCAEASYALSSPRNPAYANDNNLAHAAASGDHSRGYTVQPPPPLQPSIDPAVIDKLQSSMYEMVSLLHGQQKEIERLREELSASQTSHQSLQALQSRIDGLEGTLTSHVTGALNKHSVTEAQRLQQVLGQRETNERQKHDRLVTSVSQTLEKTISHKLDKVIKDEIRNQVLPSIKNSLDPLKASLHTEMAQKLTATDQLVKENIAKLIRSRQTIETIGASAGTAMQGPIQSACRDVLVPAFSEACHNMFLQLNTAFQRGSHEYTSALGRQLEDIREQHLAARDPLIQQLQVLTDSFERQANMANTQHVHTIADTLQQHADTAATHTQALQTSVTQTLASIEDNVVREMKKYLSEEVLPAVQDQQTSLSSQLMEAMRSQAATPVPTAVTANTPDPQLQQNHILQMLRQGQLNQAFQQALSASDLKLVMFVCETVNPAQVFNQQPCPLQQPVLLSLIQQLSAELTVQTELKHKYLEEAVMNLDGTHPVTKEHMSAVLTQLGQALLGYVTAHPQDKMSRQMRMLLMASRSLIAGQP